MTELQAHYPELAEAMQEWRFQPDAQLLQGKQILVTGAGAGIGATLAKTLALYGANIILLGRTRRKLDTVFDWIEQHTQTEAVIVPADLAKLNADSVDALADSIEQSYGGLHGIIHNASVLGAKTPIAQYPVEQWPEVFQVNVHAPFLLNRGLFPLLDQQADACIIHMSSTVGRVGRAYWGAYAASKFALEGLSQTFADETENAGRIRVYSVNPGGTRTAMRAQAYPAEDPLSVPTPETHMDMMMYLLTRAHGNVLPPTGSQLDARTWMPEANS